MAAEGGRYDALLSPSVKWSLSETLPAAAAFAAFAFIDGPLRDNPHRVPAALKAPFEGYFRARRGEYRIRYRIDEARRQIIVVDVAHRRDAYRS